MSATIRKFLAQLIVRVVALPHLAGVALALWLDEDVVKKYLDGLVTARRELDPSQGALLAFEILKELDDNGGTAIDLVAR